MGLVVKVISTDGAQVADGDVDVICVYGFAVNGDGSIPARLEVRLQAAAELAHRYPRATVLLSGGAVHNGHVEAATMRGRLLAAGVASGRMVTLTSARDTVGNVREFVEHIESGGPYRRIAAVTSIEHLARAGLSLRVALERRGHRAEVVGVAFDEEPDPAHVAWEIQHMVETIRRAAALPVA